MPRLRQRFSLEVGEQQRLGLFALQVRARIDQPIAHPVLERNTPLPTGLSGCRAGEWIRRTRQRAWHCSRAIARKPAAPVLVTGAELLLHQQRAKARAVDEQIALKGSPVGKCDRPDMTALAIQGALYDLALDALNGPAFGETAQELRIKPGIEMECINQLRKRQTRVGTRTRKTPHFGG